MFYSWQDQPLYIRIRWLRYVLPVMIVIVVIIYQLLVALAIEDRFGHLGHYSIEIIFYSLAGPIVTWSTLIWVERRVIENDLLEQQVLYQAEQLNNLTNSSADAIISLNKKWQILSWNQGATSIFQFNEKEMLGESIKRIVPELSFLQSDSTWHASEIRAITRENQNLVMDITITHKEATEENDPSHLLIMRDITPQIEREEVIEEERARIARDLHDSVAQSLYFMALKADMLKSQLAGDEQKQKEIATLGHNARNVLREVRRTIFSLSAFDWESEDFLLVLEKFIYNYANEVDWELKLHFAPNLLIRPRYQAAIFRITQESFNNIAKHANARNVAVRLEMINAGSGFKLLVEDDGNGFIIADKKNSGFGLSQMKQRVIDLKGEFVVQSELGQGAKVIVTFHSN